MTKKELDKQLLRIFQSTTEQFGLNNYLHLAEYYEKCHTYGKKLVDTILMEQDCLIDSVERYIEPFCNGYIYCDMRQLSEESYRDCEYSNNKSEVDEMKSIKHKIKYCKNSLEKLNLEREMNRLIRERNRR